jgi:hypothetical protein
MANDEKDIRPTDDLAAEPIDEAEKPVTEPVPESATEPELDSEPVADVPPADEDAPLEIEDLTPEELEYLRDSEVAFSWQASEYVHHKKGALWYLILGGGLLVAILVLVWLQYWLTVAAFVVMGAAVILYASKPPRVLMYELTPKGITIEGRHHVYSEFRSFGVVPDESWHTIDLEPVKRLNPRLSVLFDEQDYDEIVAHLELHLPRVDREPDIVERLTRTLRF